MQDYKNLVEAFKVYVEHWEELENGIKEGYSIEHKEMLKYIPKLTEMLKILEMGKYLKEMSELFLYNHYKPLLDSSSFEPFKGFN